MSKLIIAGSRTAQRYHVIQAIHSLPPVNLAFVDTVISGCAVGADTYGELWARSVGAPVERYPAEWGKYGNYAGFMRNEYMASIGDELLAVWDGVSRGTEHMISVAHDFGLEVHIHMFNPDSFTLKTKRRVRRW